MDRQRREAPIGHPTGILGAQSFRPQPPADVRTQFEVVDLNGHGMLDVTTSNKKGTYIFVQKRT